MTTRPVVTYPTTSALSPQILVLRRLYSSEEMDGANVLTGISAFPTELLHHLFAWLDPPDARSARLVCRAFGAVGKEHMLPEVPVVYRRAQLQRLVDIAKDFTVCQHVKTFYWHATRFKGKLAYDEWNGRVHNRDMSTHEVLQAFGEVNEREQRSGQTLQAAYQAYTQACDDQDLIQAQRFDKRCLTTFFRACGANLEEVILSVGNGPRRHIVRNAIRVAFRDCMIEPSGDESVIEQGVQQFSSLVEALYAAKMKPKRVSLAELSHRILERHRHTTEMLAIMPTLYEFRLALTWWDDALDEPEYNFQGQETEEYWHNSELLTWLSAASQLRVLKLGMPIPAAVEFSLRGVVKHIIPNMTFPKLHEIGLTVFEATEDELVDLLVRHKDTLRRLSLSNFNLTKGTWDSVFTRIGGKLPKLREVKLHFHFLEDDKVKYYLTVPGELCLAGPVHNAVENFLLHGGEFPDMDALQL